MKTIGAVDKNLEQLHIGDKVRLLDYGCNGVIHFKDNSISIKTKDRDYSIHDFIDIDDTDHYLNYILNNVELTVQVEVKCGIGYIGTLNGDSVL